MDTFRCVMEPTHRRRRGSSQLSHPHDLMAVELVLGKRRAGTFVPSRGRDSAYQWPTGTGSELLDPAIGVQQRLLANPGLGHLDQSRCNFSALVEAGKSSPSTKTRASRALRQRQAPPACVGGKKSPENYFLVSLSKKTWAAVFPRDVCEIEPAPPALFRQAALLFVGA
jgi:hypothetical protein